MRYDRINNPCSSCGGMGPIVMIPHALPPNERNGFVVRFYGRLQWRITDTGPLCPTCAGPVVKVQSAQDKVMAACSHDFQSAVPAGQVGEICMRCGLGRLQNFDGNYVEVGYQPRAKDALERGLRVAS